MATLKGDAVMFIVLFVGAIVAIVFLSTISDSVFSQTNAITISNNTVTPSTVGNGTTALLGREFLSGGIVTNSSNALILSPLNYSVNTTTGSNGLLTVTLIRYDGSLSDPNATGAVNVSYEANPDGFVGDVTRNINLLIPLFAALAILVFVIVMLFQPGTSFLELIKGKLGR